LEPEATTSFLALKQAITTPPMLRLPDFTKPFVIECDTSGSGLGDVLMQEARPIAFLSKALKGRALLLSTYEKELFAFVSAVQKWGLYLLGHFFIVMTDHKALKFLLDQQVCTVAQQWWLSKLLGYDFVIEFKKGKDNSLADTLSCQSNGLTKEELSITLISFPTPTWISELKESYLSDQHTTELLTALQRGDAVPKGYSLQQGLILRKGRLWVVNDSPFQQQLLTFINSNPTTGHSGYHKTI